MYLVMGLRAALLCSLNELFRMGSLAPAFSGKEQFG